MGFVTASDGAQIYYKDWGDGPPVVFSHGWPLNSDSWEAQMLYLASHGFRCVAHDRRGHGRSTQTWHGNEMNTYADDLAAVIEALDLRDAIARRVLHRRRRGRPLRRSSRHRSRRQGRARLGRATVHAADRRQPRWRADRGVRRASGPASSPTDRSRTATWPTGPFFGPTGPGAHVSQGIRDAFWLQGMQAGHRNALECIRAFSETDFRLDLAAVDVPHW